MELVIFDMDGLMIDTESITCRAYMECGKEWGLEVSEDIFFQQLVGIDSRSTFAKYRELYGQDMEAELFYKTVGKRLVQIMQEEGVPMKKGLLELLDAIEERGIRKVVASGSDPGHIRNCLEKLHLEQRFEFLISSSEVSRGKPYPDVFLEACRRAGVEPEKALVLEDSPAGVLASDNGHIPVIAIPDVLPLSHEIREKCLHVGESLLDVIPFLEP